MQKDNIYAGTSKVDVTPNGAVRVEGHLLEKICNMVHDPLYAKILVLRQKNIRVGIICCDLLHLKRDFADRVVEDIEERCDIPRGNLMIACSHTHSGPQTADSSVVKKEKKYLESLRGKLVNAARDAIKNFKEVKIGIAKGCEDAIGLNSRFRLEDGTISWCPPRKGEKVVSTGPIDPAVGIIFFKDFQDNFIATFYNYACHADAGGFSGISADYPGVASGIIEQELGGLALFTRGACGDIHPRKYGTAEAMGLKLGKEVVRRAKNISFHSCKELKSIKEEIVLPLRSLDAGQMREVDYVCERIGGRADKETIEGWKDYFRRCYRQFQELRETTKNFSTLIQVVRIGDVVLVGIPGEQFVRYGLQIKKRSKFKNTFVVNLANDSIGYIPTRKAFKEGGYQTWIGSSIITPEGGEIIEKRVLHLIDEVSRGA